MTIALQIRRIRALVSWVLLAGVALSPFVIYLNTRDEAVATSARFPADVALLAESQGQLMEVGVMRSAPKPALVVLPADVLVTLPDAGTLRAQTAFDLVGPERMAEALANTLGLRIPFWIESQATSVLRLDRGKRTSNLGDQESEAMKVFAIAAKDSFKGAGASEIFGVTRAFRANASLVRAGLRDPKQRVVPKPLTVLDPKKVRVEVLRKAGAEGSATAASATLRKKGFTISRIGNSTIGAKAAETAVYYAKGKDAQADAVVKALGIKGLKAQALPKGLTTKADVLVLAGRDALPAKASPSPKKR